MYHSTVHSSNPIVITAVPYCRPFTQMELLTRKQTQAADLHVTGRSPDLLAFTRRDGFCTVWIDPLNTLSGKPQQSRSCGTPKLHPVPSWSGTGRLQRALGEAGRALVRGMGLVSQSEGPTYLTTHQVVTGQQVLEVGPDNSLLVKSLYVILWTYEATVWPACLATIQHGYTGIT